MKTLKKEFGVTDVERKMEKCADDASCDWVIKNGNEITSDQLRSFFWSTFLKLKSINEKNRTKVIV